MNPDIPAVNPPGTAPNARSLPPGRGLTNTTASPHVKMRSVDMGAARWTKGFWAEKFELCRAAIVPNMWRLLSDQTQFSHAYHNFLVAAGLAEGRHRGPKWNDGDSYKWLEAAAYVVGMTGDKELDRLIDDVAVVLAKVQRPNGYIHTPVIIGERAGKTEERAFGERMDFETYNLGHLMTAGCVHYRATGKTNLFDLGRKAADFLRDYYATASAHLARNAVCPSHYMGVVEMYRTTGDERYRELARDLIEIRDLFKEGGDDNQDRLPLREQNEAVGHAVRANYLYAGAADVYAETGDRSLLAALETLWKSVVFEKMYVTGACGALFDGASPYGAKDQASITRTHQAYGRPYELPNAVAHAETCANIGNALWNWRMLAATGEARFADVLELVLYNSLLCGIGLDGKSFFYTNPMRVLKDQPYRLRWSRRRQPYIGCFCCPPNVARMIAETNAYAYGVSDGAVWVNLYGASTLETEVPGGAKVSLEQETDYPWDGRVRIVMRPLKSTPSTASTPPPEFALMLRIPGWARGAAVKVNGRSVRAELRPGEYVEMRRAWSAGDVVELDIPMPARILEANPLVEETLNQVAVQRGPIVYCLESADLPEGVGVLEVRVSPDVEFAARMDSDLLAGERVVVLEGKAARVVAQGDWAGRLYREARRPKSEPLDIRLVPYYAWGNRGEGEMTVWIPERGD